MPENSYRLPYREELRRKWPGLARRAERGSALAAIRLGCAECNGGLLEVVACTDMGCFLYRYRMGHRPSSKLSRKHQKPGGDGVVNRRESLS